MRIPVGKIFTWGDPTIHIKESNPTLGSYRTFIKFSVFIYGAWICYQVLDKNSVKVDGGEEEIFYLPKVYKTICFINTAIDRIRR